MKQLIYLDNAATTKTRPEVVEAMLPYFTEQYGNPSSVYDFSSGPKKAIAHARETIAKALGDKADTGYRKEIKGLGFAEAELLVEYGYPTQRFILQQEEPSPTTGR